MFAVGSYVSYPVHGTAVVKGIVQRTMGGALRDFYNLSVLANGTTLLIEVDRAEMEGVRAVMSPEEVDAVLALVSSEPESIRGTTWNRRFRELNGKLREATPGACAEVIRDLHQVRRNAGDLSFGEKKLIDRALTLLSHEIAASIGISPEAAEGRILDRLP